MNQGYAYGHFNKDEIAKVKAALREAENRIKDKIAAITAKQERDQDAACARFFPRVTQMLWDVIGDPSTPTDLLRLIDRETSVYIQGRGFVPKECGPYRIFASWQRALADVDLDASHPMIKELHALISEGMADANRIYDAATAERQKVHAEKEANRAVKFVRN